ncbi:GrpB family protein [Frondihabitans sp. PAMC 28766]|uniref:GrpB family protein n=1 Tax=Frondihabitans sp. PAMC 28766 TaxID=1795630 RepID=UPI000AD49DEE|nr:GrpB family protein [Frondihabitans sp. PAMC 28766]
MALHPLWRPFAPGSNAVRQSQRVAHRQTEPGALRPHEESWATDFDRVCRVIEAALPGGIHRLTHVGSTAIPGVVAKPVIDIDLVVDDVSDEMTYVPQLEAAGFTLIFRDDMAGDPHRQLTFAAPNTNLHVWSPSAVEPRRHELFAEWLVSHPEERQLYSDAKTAAAADPSRRYNDAKAAVVYDIYERAFAADPLHEHTPQPRH